MDNHWSEIVRTVVVGTERQPVSEALLTALGIAPHEDPVRTALSALPAAHLLHRAAAPLEAVVQPMVSACPPDPRPVCPPAVVQPLLAMVLHDAYPAVLPELFALLNARRWRLPPEVLPRLLDFLVRKKMFAPPVYAALGLPARWLAAQNPDWAAFVKKLPAAPAKHARKGKRPDALPGKQYLEVDWPTLPEALWRRCVLDLIREDARLETPDSALATLLLESEHVWPKAVLLAVLEYPLRQVHPRQWSPPKHLRALLQRAALRCRPADAQDYGQPARDWPYAWHNELVQLRGVVQFRARLWEIFR